MRPGGAGIPGLLRLRDAIPAEKTKFLAKPAFICIIDLLSAGQDGGIGRRSGFKIHR